MPLLSPWPIRTPMWTGASDTMSPTWSLWLSNLVKAVNIEAPVVFANLPAPPEVGQVAVVSDSNTNAWGTVVAGGGAFQVLAWYNGTDWSVIGI
jgi:hypothetical protein